MKKELNTKQIRSLCLNAKIFPKEVLEWIAAKNLWNVWVPKLYGGLEKSLSEGLKTLRDLATIDGSLGWTITLCSGANYFIGNLEPEVAAEIFNDSRERVCFGGSGGAFGKAEKEAGKYNITGRWQYATGAPYLTHFTLNAKIFENGKPLQNSDGSAQIKSFVIPRRQVEIIEDWNTMGLLPTATHSFDVNELRVNEKYSFTYNRFYMDQPIFKIPFSIFADLTLWVNYVGMATHFLEASQPFLTDKKLRRLSAVISSSNDSIFSYANELEDKIASKKAIKDELEQSIHEQVAAAVRETTEAIIELYPFLGIKACRSNNQLNQVFRDYFTATQHHIFVDR